tara:strand:- start:707 stop:1114 length:408 start_codon:yes stop_codon:yes gene_type:complete
VPWQIWLLAFNLLFFYIGCHGEASTTPATNIVELTDDNFQSEVLASKQPVLVEFWAPWCRPCVEMSPIVESIAQEFSGKAKVYRMRIDSNFRTLAAFDVESPPYLILFRDGNVIKRRSGKQTERELRDLLTNKSS